ncbi:MAG: helix-turn-helix transcriptional regulator [Ruminococcaceae bacterium]|nr:helix-turn-helix transcriptional regulator [Oscillospiraceae bacterium]
MMTDASLSFFHCHKYEMYCHSVDYGNRPRPFSALAYIISGEARFYSNDRSDLLRPGDLVYTHIGSCYHQEWKQMSGNGIISCQFIFKNPPFPFAGRRLFVQKVDGLSDTLPDFEYILAHRDDPATYFDVMARFYRIMAAVAPKLEGVELPPADPLISRAVEYIDANCHRPIKVAELAGLCKLSESHFYTRFHQAVGCSPIEYKHRAAIGRAERLFISDPSLTIDEISYRTGFESSSYFRRTFRKITGMSPSDYRDTVWKM